MIVYAERSIATLATSSVIEGEGQLSHANSSWPLPRRLDLGTGVFWFSQARRGKSVRGR